MSFIFIKAVTNACTYKVCGDEWNSTHKVPIWAVNDGLFGGDSQDHEEGRPSVVVEIRTAESSPPRWHDLVLPPQEVSKRKIYSQRGFVFICKS